MACIVYPSDLIDYQPLPKEPGENGARFQWPLVEDTEAERELSEFLADLSSNHTDCFLIVNRTDPLEGILKVIDGKLFFQLKLTTQVAKSVIPQVPAHLRSTS